MTKSDGIRNGFTTVIIGLEGRKSNLGGQLSFGSSVSLKRYCSGLQGGD